MISTLARQNRCRAFSRGAAGGAGVLSAAVITGWAFDVSVLKSLVPGLPTMKPNTALCFGLTGVALWILARPHPPVAAYRIAQLAAGLAALVGAATFAQYLFAADLGIDALLFREALPLPGSPYPERMSAMTALSFAGAGSALLTLDSRRLPMAAQVLTLIGVLTCFTALVGYAYGVRALYSPDAYSSVALPTALGLGAVAVGILCARPTSGVIGVLMGDTAGGSLARRLLPIAIVLPLILGWLRLQGERAGLYQTAFGTGAYAVSNVVLFVTVILWYAGRLSRSDVERRRAEQELKRSNEELERFAYVASHDLQEPLRMVGSYAQLLGKRYRGKLDADGDEFIGYLVDGATRMRRLVEDLLTYSRVGTRGQALVNTDAGAVLERVLGTLRQAIEEKGARVTHDPLPTVAGDAVQLEHLFLNLLTNALKFRGSDPPVVHVSATPGNDLWTFSVRDNGIGIEPQHFDRIFVMFQRLHAREDYPGTGIGLAICRKIVERHGGTIWVESTPGRGATFRFTLRSVGGTP